MLLFHRVSKTSRPQRTCWVYCKLHKMFLERDILFLKKALALLGRFHILTLRLRFSGHWQPFMRLSAPSFETTGAYSEEWNSTLEPLCIERKHAHFRITSSFNARSRHLLNLLEWPPAPDFLTTSLDSCIEHELNVEKQSKRCFLSIFRT